MMELLLSWLTSYEISKGIRLAASIFQAVFQKGYRNPSHQDES